jgi:hypothetical protein
MAAKQRSKHQKELYSAYKSQNRFAVNRKRKLLKVQKAQPNNLQIAEALGNIKYRRKTPKTAVNSKQKIAAAKLKSQVSRTVVTFDKPNEKSMFKLATRAHTKGVPVV